MKSVKRSFLLLLSLLALAACQSNKGEPAICPRVSALADTVTLTQFRPGPGRDISDVAFKAEMTSYHGSCAYDADEKKMKLKLNVGIDAERRPALDGRHAEFSYFIAIPAFRPDPAAKAILPVVIDFPAGSDRVHYTDGDVNIEIPIADLKQVARYEVFVGLQLTEEQVEFNRKQRGPR